MQRTAAPTLATALERTAPSRAHWDSWSRRDPALADLTYEHLRLELRNGDQRRKDELLGALVRAARADPNAFPVVATCLLPGLRRRITRYAPSLDHDEAFAIVVTALYEAVAKHDTGKFPYFVASRLLDLPTRRLRRAVAQHRSWMRHRALDDATVSVAPGPLLSAATLLAGAVAAGAVTPHDAQLIHDTRVDGRPLREAAQRLGLGYEAARKRRQRAEARWIDWWPAGVALNPRMSDRRGAA